MTILPGGGQVFSSQVRAIADDLGAKADMWFGDDDEVARNFLEASGSLHAAADRLEEREQEEAAR